MSIPPVSGLPATALPAAGRRALERQLESVADQRVRSALLSTPRHLFVPDHLQAAAYDDCPLPIGHGQTISQPLMIAHMLSAAALKGLERVLDVGCGSGYQAALLAALCSEVVGIEIVPELVELARTNLARVGSSNVSVSCHNGRLGFADRSPYDVILVAAASADVPAPLLDQLAPGGRLLIPIGPPSLQVLQCWTRTQSAFEVIALDACRFVPLVQ
jgi:protein-L-isoaspartate(D-aspartate) O-methyltransferase